MNTVRHRNRRALLRFILILVALVTSFAVAFQFMMAFEDQDHSWVTGFYWTLSTMSTLGYGDVSFSSDPGRLFSITVLLSGMIFMLVLLPITFIELFYEPWMEARAASSIPRTVPADFKGHVILTFHGPVAAALISKLAHFHYPYVVILPELDEVMALGDKGIRAIFGNLDDPETYRNARVEHAAMVATTRPDIVNTSVVFTVRGITSTTPVISTSREETSSEILRMAGCSRILDITHLMAEGLARRAIGGNQFSHVVGEIDDLLIAEVEAGRTTLVGKSYPNAQFETSISIVGFWKRGEFEVGQPDSIVQDGSVLVMAGSREQFDKFDKEFDLVSTAKEHMPVVVIGGGRLGRQAAIALKRRGIDYCIVEQLEERIRDEANYVHGSGSDKAVLQRAGFMEAPSVIITTHDDETNIYLAIYCRLLRPDIQIICRANLERNVDALHRAGADIVLSYASMGANAFFNLLHRSDLLMVAEGLDVFKVPVPKELVGKTLGESNIRARTNCTVIGIDTEQHTLTNPPIHCVLPAHGELVLIGTQAGETKFLDHFNSDPSLG